jgi:hypothetical protein
MSNWKKVSAVALGSLVLAGCGNGVPDDLAENWGTYLAEAEEELESYATEMSLFVGSEDMGGRDGGYISARVIGDFDQGHVIATNENNGNESSTELYFDEELAFQNEGSGWQEVTGNGEMSADSSYRQVMNAVIEVEELVDADLTEETLQLSYQGHDQAIWDAFEEPFSLSLDGFTMEETLMTLDVTVNPETQYMEVFHFLVEAENNFFTIDLEVNADYTEFNEIDNFDEVEEEIDSDINA